ncbi:hypothetical protein [Micavibrio aeruginosavorus]|nr:hypothetical protein [Micavibrio aeruginosavorus]
MTMLLGLATAPAIAADYTFAPNGCEFAMTFPEQPTSAERCDPAAPTQCTHSSVFVKVYGMDSSMRVTATCSPAEDNMLKRYSGDVMRFTLESMAKGNAKTYETGFNDLGTAKQAILLGSTPNDHDGEDVYMAQLWIGEKSVLTIEGVLTGVQTPDSDSTFTGIMKSIRTAPTKATATKADEETENKDKKEDKAEPEEPTKE